MGTQTESPSFSLVGYCGQKVARLGLFSGLNERAVGPQAGFDKKQEHFGDFSPSVLCPHCMGQGPVFSVCSICVNKFFFVPINIGISQPSSLYLPTLDLLPRLIIGLTVKKVFWLLWVFCLFV